jgi:hypothetical protein
MSRVENKVMTKSEYLRVSAEAHEATVLLHQKGGCVKSDYPEIQNIVESFAIRQHKVWATNYRINLAEELQWEAAFGPEVVHVEVEYTDEDSLEKQAAHSEG